MSTSGSTDFSMTGKQIITSSLNLIAERGAEVPGTSDEIADGLTDLNMMTKSWMTSARHLWTIDEAVLFLRPGITNYTIGTAIDQCTLVDDFIPTTLSTAPIAGASVITVADTTGMGGLIDSGTADKIGIRLADNTRQWTTISNINSSTSIQLTDVLRSAGASGDSVFTYTADLNKPLRVPDSRRLTFQQDDEIPLAKWSNQQYFAQTLKTSQGTPTNFYYKPQRNDGKMYIWQTAADVDQMLKFTFERALHDFDSNSNNPDFPVEWNLCLVWNLAVLMGPQYKIPLQDLMFIKTKAEELLEDLLGWDEEVTSLNVQPDYGS